MQRGKVTMSQCFFLGRACPDSNKVAIEMIAGDQCSLQCADFCRRVFFSQFCGFSQFCELVFRKSSGTMARSFGASVHWRQNSRR